MKVSPALIHRNKQRMVIDSVPEEVQVHSASFNFSDY